jgi:surface protein
MVYYGFGRKTKIFGKNFVKNNKGKCIFFYKNRIYSLNEYYCKKKNENEEFLIILLLELYIIFNKSFMFHQCEDLVDFTSPEIDQNALADIFRIKEPNSFYSNNQIISTKNNYKNNDDLLNTINSNEGSSFLDNNKYKVKLDPNIYDGINSFYDAHIINLSDIKNINTNNADNLSSYLYLLSFHNISKWKTNFLDDISNIFYEYISLLSLPDISKWETKNIRNMS